MIERRLLTQAVVEAAETSGQPIGNSNAPITGGWQGEPNLDGSNFVPYAVVTPQTSTFAAGPISDPEIDRQIPYAISSFGVLPEQTEWMADKVRAAVEALKKTEVTLGDGTYKIQQVRTNVMGGLNRVDSTDPPYWGQVDVLTLWLTR
jgi:hypothetical protein